MKDVEFWTKDVGLGPVTSLLCTVGAFVLLVFVVFGIYILVGKLANRLQNRKKYGKKVKIKGNCRCRDCKYWIKASEVDYCGECRAITGVDPFYTNECYTCNLGKRVN